MYEILIGAALIFGYILVGAVVGTIVYRIEGDEDLAQFIGALWPISLPLIALLGTIYGTVCLVKNAKMPSIPKRKTAEQKVFDYSKSPILVLAQIVAQRITAYPQGITKYNDTWTSEDKSIIFETIGSNGNFYRLTVKDKTWSSIEDKKAKDILSDAYRAAKKFQEEKKKADAEAAKQLAALEAVELLLLSPEPSTTKE